MRPIFSTGRQLFLVVLCCLLNLPAAAKDVLDIPITYIEQRIERPPVLSNLRVWPDDEGLRGAELGIEDNNTTGRFLNHNYALDSTIVDADTDVIDAVREKLGAGSLLVVLNVHSDVLQAIAQLPEAADDLLFNARETDTDLRNELCEANVLHTMASRRMLSDALMQFYAKRQWRELFLIEGNRAGDRLLASSFRQSARKFGLKIVEDKTWLEDADIRRVASSEVPGFTQARKYDAVVVADEDQDFSPYLLYNTWLPRPIGGSAGMTPVVWSSVVEQWGAAQLQSRFNEQAARGMNSIDYANWVAIRAIGEAVTRTNVVNPEVIRKYLLSEQFSLAGFKGVSLSFRAWNGQLRQPIPLVHPQAVVTTAPIEGFLHASSELDTLGLDAPESQCAAFR